jgi:hypothetical protein
MRVTFRNRLKKEELCTGASCAVVFNHALRAPITVRIVHDPRPAGAASAIDWAIKFESTSKLLVQQLRADPERV